MGLGVSWLRGRGAIAVQEGLYILFFDGERFRLWVGRSVRYVEVCRIKGPTLSFDCALNPHGVDAAVRFASSEKKDQGSEMHTKEKTVCTMYHRKHPEKSRIWQGPALVFSTKSVEWLRRRLGSILLHPHPQSQSPIHPRPRRLLHSQSRTSLLLYFRSPEIEPSLVESIPF